MPSTIKLSDTLLKEASKSGKARHRSPPKQIEYWARLGQIAEQHPDLSFRFIQDMLVTVNDGEESNSLSRTLESDSAVQ